MHNTIKVGDVSINFHKSRHETQGAFDLYEATFPPNSGSILPHFHRDYDETILGIDGRTHWLLDGQHRDLGPSEQLYIPRGMTNCVMNLHKSPARILCLVTPGILGPEYFRELASLKRTGSYNAPDRDEVHAVMARYGVFSVPTSEV
jgi:quercetin dioxygenase-like cupin family protein